MTQTATMQPGIDFAYEASGEVLCRNDKGLVFFLFAPKPLVGEAAPAPRQWKQVEATQEVAVRRETEPQAIAELTRSIPKASAATFVPVAATQEVEVRRVAPEPVAATPAPVVRGTGPLPNVPEPGKPAQKGWFNKLFSKA
jgi:hypothetical protein